jgi:hypothetical protein
MLLQQLLIFPLALAYKLLHRLNVATLQSHSHRLDRLLLDWCHYPLKILVAPMSLFSAIEKIGKLGMVRYQFIRQSFDLLWRQIQQFGSLVKLNDFKSINIHCFPAFLLQGFLP